MNTDSAPIAEALRRLHDVDISRFDAGFLNRSIEKRMTETRCGSVREYCVFLEHNENEGKLLFDSLHIHHSEYFRNALTFSVLERIVLPELILQRKGNRRNEMRVWSAGCAAGEEPYSLAILLEELATGCSEKIGYRIFATDLSEPRIAEAQKGVYASRALHNLTLGRTIRWFTKHGETYTVVPALKERMDFSVFDLLSERLANPPGSIFGDFDLVMCANLLFYYAEEFRKVILDKIVNSLARRGLLVTGEAERELFMSYGFSEIVSQSAIFRV
jgi:chemotaxis protein methyltransferase CheR